MRRKVVIWLYEHMKIKRRNIRKPRQIIFWEADISTFGGHLTTFRKLDSEWHNPELFIFRVLSSEQVIYKFIINTTSGKVEWWSKPLLLCYANLDLRRLPIFQESFPKSTRMCAAVEIKWLSVRSRTQLTGSNNADHLGSNTSKNYFAEVTLVLQNPHTTLPIASTPITIQLLLIFAPISSLCCFCN